MKMAIYHAKEGKHPHAPTLGGHRRYPARTIHTIAEILKVSLHNEPTDM